MGAGLVQHRAVQVGAPIRDATPISGLKRPKASVGDDILGVKGPNEPRRESDELAAVLAVDVFVVRHFTPETPPARDLGDRAFNRPLSSVGSILGR